MIFPNIEIHFLLSIVMKIELISSSCKGSVSSCPKSSPISIKVNGKTPRAVKSSLQKAGFVFVSLLPSTGDVEKVIHVNMRGKKVEFGEILKRIPKPRVLLGVIKEDGFSRLSKKSMRYLEVCWMS